MSGSHQRKTRANQQETAKSKESSPSEISKANKLAMEASMEAIQANIIAELRKVQDDAKKELIDNIEALKSEVTGFRGEMGKRMDDIAEDLKGVTQRVEETEQRVADIEEFNADAKEALEHALQLQVDLQTRISDLEARSRRNNIRIHGIVEEAEGTNMLTFMENFLKSELNLTNTPLNIQRCHRSLGPKPPMSASPRSIVMCFLEYTTKEKVLRTAWEKKVIEFSGKRVYFDHDYPSDILLKRKAYNPIRKTLKEKGYRFQTLYPARLRVFLDGTTIVYSSLDDATDDLKKRGVIQAGIDDTAPSALSHKPRKAAWEKARGARWSRDDRTKYIQDKLKGFRRPESTE